ncbi:helix-turn-helix domain-containing protein [Paraburkholderia fungorum]|uniref:helix-turn-helix domain-containing protein n=1 Tax=Paraburkholderia fungorum TaxID=134537 RepID=UPI000944067E|nr:helix-turn-helix domain-containing protein [Paraburkholderia fungorum]
MLSFSGSCAGREKLAGLGSIHFARLFRLETGETNEAPHEFVTRLRLEESARLLRTTCQTVLQIAIAVGFGGTSHFSARCGRDDDVIPLADRLPACRMNARRTERPGRKGTGIAAGSSASANHARFAVCCALRGLQTTNFRGGEWLDLA